MKAIFWMRRDLRFFDNRALAMATKDASEVYPVFIFDENILNKLPKDDHRVEFLFNRLQELKRKHHIHIFYGNPVDLIPKLAQELGDCPVYTNEDYESYANERDIQIEKRISLKKYLDHIIFHGSEIRTGAGKAYKVYTPFKNKWLETLESQKNRIFEFKVDKKRLSQYDFSAAEISQLDDFGFKKSQIVASIPTDGEKVLAGYLDRAHEYSETRDFPALDNTSRLSVHLRFGTVSTRHICRQVFKLESLPQAWLNQIIWRDFFYSILQNFPHVEQQEFNPQYQGIGWREDETNFQAWCRGETGFPLIDAGMRELNQTGYMHNRVRMVVASFLTKNLLLDWRLGERYFAGKLFDFDLAVNNGSWQWASSTGCDAQPYFRVFNPESQVKRFDPDGEYIKKWVPELTAVPARYFSNMGKFTEEKQAECGVVIGKDYPAPIVDLKQTRIRAIAHFKNYSSALS